MYPNLERTRRSYAASASDQKSFLKRFHQRYDYPFFLLGFFMEQNEINTLRILEAFEQDPSQTQRDLAQRLKISLGMVNALTKRLAEKRYLKITNMPKNRMQYLLTPKGMVEKTQLTYQFVLHSMQYYRDARSRLQGIFRDLAAKQKERIFLFGISELAEICYITLQETDIVLAGVIDDDRAGEQFLGHQIESMTILENINSTDAIIITDIDKSNKAMNLLLAYGIDFNQIIDLRTNGELSMIDLQVDNGELMHSSTERNCNDIPKFKNTLH